MTSRRDSHEVAGVTRFDRTTFSPADRLTAIGTGELGAKAFGLARMRELLETQVAPLFRPVVELDIPLLTVVTTSVFDQFLEENRLEEFACGENSDPALARAFLQASFPVDAAEDLRAFLRRVENPLAIRSSSLLEDRLGEPFAGVYATCMVGNNQPDIDARLDNLIRSIKQVYASTFMKKSRDYMRAVRRSTHEEKMAVLVQEVVGARHGERFYPHISGVARSHHFYPLGLVRPEDGVVELALGLGKTVVDDGVAWTFSPAYPQVSPPYNTVRDLLKQTQRAFWAVDLSGRTASTSPEPLDNLRQFGLATAESDGVLGLLASTYLTGDDRVVMGVTEAGPRILNFAPILKGEVLPLASLLQKLLKECEKVLGSMVALEFALTLQNGGATRARMGFLQARPMVVSEAIVDVASAMLSHDDAIVASESVLGNGRLSGVRNIVYLRPENFDVTQSRAIGQELEKINQGLLETHEPYVLIGFGRWGSSDPSAGIPVNFGQISGARVIVETTTPDINFMLSQGSHFFHNVTSFKILYFSVSHTGPYPIKWEWLGELDTVSETAHVRHVRATEPLEALVDGRTGRGVILKRTGS